MEGIQGGFLRRFKQLRLYRDKIETQNQEELPFSSGIFPRGLSVAEGSLTALHNAAFHKC